MNNYTDEDIEEIKRTIKEIRESVTTAGVIGTVTLGLSIVNVICVMIFAIFK